MQPQTFIFFGPSGSGKGTQAKLLMDELKKKDPERDILYIETGDKLRELAKGSHFTSKEINKLLENGDLAPVFLPIWAWAGKLIEDVNGNEHIFMDGISRRVEEAYVLDSAIKFYKRESPIIISIEVSREWAAQRLKERGRSDDDEEEIKKRLDWYERDVKQSIEYFKNDPDYRFIAIDGEHTIEEVHNQLMEKVGL